MLEVKDSTGIFYSSLFLDSTSKLTQMVNFLTDFMTKDATSILVHGNYLDINIPIALAY